MKIFNTNNNIISQSSVLIVSLLLIFAGCSNSSNGGAGVKGFSSGVITAKGSIFVNGIEYETNSSSISLDNQSGIDSDLKVGMVVDVKGTIDEDSGTGVADEVDYASSIEGTVDTGSIDSVAGTFEVFGLIIQTDAATVFEGVTGMGGVTPLAAGNRVEISGMSNGTSILASRVEVKTGSTEDFKVKGIVSSLSGVSNGTFDLTMEGGIVLSVSFTGTLDSGINNGSRVKVEISTAPIGGSVNTTADKIELKHELSIDEGDRVEVEGIVSNFVDGTPDTFTVGDVNISASGSLTSGVANGVEIEVKGSMEGGVLVASEISLEEEADFEFKGVVTSANVSAGTLVINGVTVYATSKTIFFDDLDSPVAFFGLDDLSSGNYLEVKVFNDTVSGHLVAIKIERNESDTDAVLEGIVTSIAGTVITVNGLNIDTTPLFGNTGDRDTFLGLLTAGTTVVNLTGDISGITVTWQTVVVD